MHNLKAIHNKDYSVVKTFRAVRKHRPLFFPPPLQNKKFKHLTSVSQISNLKGDKLEEYLMMKNARWDNEVVLDYIEQHDSDAFKKHDAKVLKEKAKLQKSKGVSIDIIADTFGLTKEEIEAL